MVDEAEMTIVFTCAHRADHIETAVALSLIHISDWHDVVSDPSIDIVVEVIGGEHPATEIFEQSFAAGKHEMCIRDRSSTVSDGFMPAAGSSSNNRLGLVASARTISKRR